MQQILFFTLFLLTFLIIYGSINFYVIWRILNLFTKPLTFFTYFIICIATFSYLFASFLERLTQNIFSTVIYTLSAVWMGIIFLALPSLFIYEIIKYFFKPFRKQAGVGVLIITFFLSSYSLLNATKLNINETDIILNNLKKPLKIVQISDIHVGTIYNSRLIQKITMQINQIKPDYVFITGDLVDGSGPLRSDIYKKIDKIQAPIFFVTGNHENYVGLEKVLEILNQTKIKVLKDEKIETEDLQIIGLNFKERKNNLKILLSSFKINTKKPSIILAHNPNIIQETRILEANLQLSGHTHNGQIFPFNYIVKIFYPHIKGLYQIDKTMLYVSPGTGTWGPPMRLGSQNEITILNLNPQN